MKVKELIKQLQKADENATVIIDGCRDFMVWVGLDDTPVEIELEREDETEHDDYFNNLIAQFEDIYGNMGEVLDAMKINGVQ